MLKMIANAISNVSYSNRGITKNDSQNISGEKEERFVEETQNELKVVLLIFVIPKRESGK
jgi:hypothetical protein